MKFNLLFSFLFMFSLTQSSEAQNKKVEVQCGDKVEETFSYNREKIDLVIYLEAGDNLKISSNSKYGDILKYYLRFHDPAGNQILNFKTPYGKGSSSFKVETGPLPASGKYFLRFFCSKTIGDFITELVCEKASGEVISAQNSQKPATAKQEEKPDFSQFMSIPLGTPMEGEIKSGSNHLFGFKTKINQNTKVNLDFSLLEGNAPVEIKIYDKDDGSVIFYSSLKYGNSQKTSLTIPKTGDYITTVREIGDSGRSAVLTKFEIILK